MRDECGSATLAKMVGAGTEASGAYWFPSLNKQNQKYVSG